MDRIRLNTIEKIRIMEIGSGCCSCNEEFLSGERVLLVETEQWNSFLCKECAKYNRRGIEQFIEKDMRRKKREWGMLKKLFFEGDKIKKKKKTRYEIIRE